MKRYTVSIILHAQFCEADESIPISTNIPYEQIAETIAFFLKHPAWKHDETSVQIIEISRDASSDNGVKEVKGPIGDNEAHKLIKILGRRTRTSTIPNTIAKYSEPIDGNELLAFLYFLCSQSPPYSVHDAVNQYIDLRSLPEDKH